MIDFTPQNPPEAHSPVCLIIPHLSLHFRFTFHTMISALYHHILSLYSHLDLRPSIPTSESILTVFSTSLDFSLHGVGAPLQLWQKSDDNPGQYLLHTPKNYYLLPKTAEITKSNELAGILDFIDISHIWDFGGYRYSM